MKDVLLFRNNKISLRNLTQMAVITFDYEDIISLMGKRIPVDELIEKIPMIGASFERRDGNEISIEIFPDRPDMLSVEGLARAMRAFLGIEKGAKIYEVAEPKVKIEVDKSVNEIRPYIAGCVVKNIELDDKSIASLMDLQEKLHFSIGKDRKKMAIGVHDFDMVTPPFVYKAVKPDEISFVPLAMEEEMNLKEILEKHDKGIAYAHLLEGKEKYPVILDSHGNVLSFPPVINGALTAVKEETKNLFIDVTGTDKNAVLNALVIMASSLAERGGKLEAVFVGESVTPDMSYREMKVDVEYIHKISGMDLSPDEISESLSRMGYDVKIEDNKIKVLYPPWRVDILHPIDVVEDIIIGYGYENVNETLPSSMTFGSSINHDRIHDTMLGLGFTEVFTLTLSSKEKEFEKMSMEEKEVVEISNPISSFHSIVRQSLLPSLLEILSKNRHNDLPQSIYEVGDVISDMEQKKMLAGAKIDARAGFTECKSIVEAILRNFGIKMEVEEKEHPSFISGRCASIIANGKEIGYFGELKPEVITSFELEYPVIAFEMELSSLSKDNQYN